MTFRFSKDSCIIFFLIYLSLMRMRFTACVLLLFVVYSCSSPDKLKTKIFEKMENTGINFVNVVVDDSIDNSFLFRNFYNGGGVAIGDINNDGLPDIFFTSNTAANKLYLNKGNFQFEDISEKAGIIADDKWNTGVTFADVNGDGWLDIYVSSSGHMSTGNRKNKLYINEGNLHFTEQADKYGLGISAYTTQVSFFDYDLDGDLDCFMINNSPIPINQLNFANRRDLPDTAWKIAKFLQGGGDHLYRNDNGFFKEVTRDAGIHGGLISFGLGVSVGDINNDGWPDVFVSNDSYERDYLYINQRDGTFRDELEDWVQHTSFSSMGTDIADINNDGYPDLFTTDMLALDDYRLKTTGSFDNISLFNSKLDAGFYFQYTKNCLQLNNRNGKFLDIARYAGVEATDWSWGALMFDMDNDGWNDLLVCNGVNRDVTNLDFMDFFANDLIQRMVLTGKKNEIDQVVKEIPRTPLPNKVYRNDRTLRFTDIGEEWGLGEPCFSNGAAYGDLDNDGDLDLVISNMNQPGFIYKNNSREVSTNHFLSVKLKGKDKNLFAIGSRVQVFMGDQILTREQVPSRGFQSSVDYTLVFGLGENSAIDSLVVTWPDRSQSRIMKPGIDQVLQISQSESGPGKNVATQFAPPIGSEFFSLADSSFTKPVENNYIDFYQERGIPRILSREGPAASAADVDGDGLIDIFIGGASGSPGILYRQLSTGRFKAETQGAFSRFAEFEDVYSLFFDADKDGDMDLLVCPGGNNFPVNSRELELRLYKNDGKGNFELDAPALPSFGLNASIACAHDFTGDGFPDLFIGGRSYPGEYGRDAGSFLLVNDGRGRFTNQTAELNPEFSRLGMVTGACFADVSDFPGKELVIVGEWMAPRIFSYQNNRFQEVPSNLGNHSGWWQTVQVADLNNDGKDDLIFGNIGENFYLNPDPKNPVKLWRNDFDGNDFANTLLSYTIDGKDMPVFLKNELQDQLPSIKKKNLKHEQYARQTVQDLFSKELIRSSSVRSFTFPSHCVAIQEKSGQFAVSNLPVMTQLSCINAIVPGDFDGNGTIDLLVGGNQFGFLPQFEKLDANLGEILLNDGKGNFKIVEAALTGLTLRGQMRYMLPIQDKFGYRVLFVQNSEKPVLYKLNRN